MDIHDDKYGLDNATFCHMCQNRILATQRTMSAAIVIELGAAPDRCNITCVCNRLGCMETQYHITCVYGFMLYYIVYTCCCYVDFLISYIFFIQLILSVYYIIWYCLILLVFMLYCIVAYCLVFCIIWCCSCEYVCLSACMLLVLHGYNVACGVQPCKGMIIIVV